MTDSGRSGAYQVTGLPDHAEIAWGADIGFPVYGRPVLADDTLVVGDSLGRVHAFDAVSGERRWRSPDRDYDLDPDDEVYTTVVDVWRDQVIVGVCDGDSYFDSFAGADYDDEELEDEEVEEDEELDDGELQLLDLRSGKPSRTIDRGWYPAVVGDRLILISLNAGVRALSLPDLTPLWWNKDAGGRVQTAPAAGPDDLIYLSGGWEGNHTHGGVLALGLRTGEMRFEYDPGEEAYAQTNPTHAAVAEGLVWKPVNWHVNDKQSDPPGEIVGLDPLTGEMRWSHSVQAPLNGSVAVANGTVYFAVYGDGPAVHAVDIKTRRLAWTRRLPAAGIGGPVLAAGVVYMATCEGTVLALDAASGETRWSLDLGQDIAVKEPNLEALYEETPSAVLPADGMLYVRTHTGVVALR